MPVNIMGEEFEESVIHPPVLQPCNLLRPDWNGPYHRGKRYIAREYVDHAGSPLRESGVLQYESELFVFIDFSGHDYSLEGAPGLVGPAIIISPMAAVKEHCLHLLQNNRPLISASGNGNDVGGRARGYAIRPFAIPGTVGHRITTAIVDRNAGEPGNDRGKMQFERYITQQLHLPYRLSSSSEDRGHGIDCHFELLPGIPTTAEVKFRYEWAGGFPTFYYQILENNDGKIYQ